MRCVWTANFLNVFRKWLAVIDTVVVNSSLHLANTGFKNEFLPCAHLLCKAGSASVDYHGQMNTVFLSSLSRKIFPTCQILHPLSYATQQRTQQNPTKYAAKKAVVPLLW
jgi:hypothetical protein